MMRQPHGSRWVIPVVAVTIAVLSLVGLRHARPGTAASQLDPRISWTGHVASVDAELAAGRVSGAVRAWHDAHAAALASGSWQPMVDIGDAYLRIGRAAAQREASQAKARQAYLVALFRARAQGSVDGVLRATDAFARLGDDEVVTQGLRMARRLAAEERDPGSQSRVGEVEARLAARLFETKRGQADRF